MDDAQLTGRWWNRIARPPGRGSEWWRGWANLLMWLRSRSRQPLKQNDFSRLGGKCGLNSMMI